MLAGVLTAETVDRARRPRSRRPRKRPSTIRERSRCRLTPVANTVAEGGEANVHGHQCDGSGPVDVGRTATLDTDYTATAVGDGEVTGRDDGRADPNAESAGRHPGRGRGDGDARAVRVARRGVSVETAWARSAARITDEDALTVSVSGRRRDGGGRKRGNVHDRSDAGA